MTDIQYLGGMVGSRQPVGDGFPSWLFDGHFHIQWFVSVSWEAPKTRGEIE